MKANELRIGNWVTYKNGNEQSTIEFVNFDFIANNAIHINMFFEPIPLTEEWLLKFGFEKDSNRPYLWCYDISSIEREGLIIMWSQNKGSFYFNCSARSIELKYVHQLQNLYFVLEGLELKIKP